MRYISEISPFHAQLSQDSNPGLLREKQECYLRAKLPPSFKIFLPQMRLIHQSDYSLEERLMYKPIVYANAIQSMSILLNAVEKLSECHGVDLENHC